MEDRRFVARGRVREEQLAEMGVASEVEFFIGSEEERELARIRYNTEYSLYREAYGLNSAERKAAEERIRELYCALKESGMTNRMSKWHEQYRRYVQADLAQRAFAASIGVRCNSEGGHGKTAQYAIRRYPYWMKIDLPLAYFYDQGEVCKAVSYRCAYDHRTLFTRDHVTQDELPPCTMHDEHMRDMAEGWRPWE